MDPFYSPSKTGVVQPIPDTFEVFLNVFSVDLSIHKMNLLTDFRLTLSTCISRLPVEPSYLSDCINVISTGSVVSSYVND